jgi:hypothetical protein
MRTKTLRHLAVISCLLSIALLFPPTGEAQTTARIVGTVTDRTGAVVPGVALTWFKPRPG